MSGSISAGLEPLATSSAMVWTTEPNPSAVLRADEAFASWSRNQRSGQSSRPEEWQGRRAPPELLSGHHAQIERWRRQRRLEATARLRPDLLAAAREARRLTPADETFLATLARPDAGGL